MATWTLTACRVCVCPCVLTGGLTAAADPLAGGLGASTLGSMSVYVL